MSRNLVPHSAIALALVACAIPVGCARPPAAPSTSSASAGVPAQGSTAGLTPESRDQIDADGVARRGERLSSLVALSVTECVARAKSLDGQTVKVRGTVDSVCEKKGCWFVVQGDNPSERIRITSLGYKFFVPRSSVGRTAVLEGKLEVKVLDAATAQHYEDDRASGAGEAPKKVDAATSEIDIAAAGLELLAEGA